MSWSGDSEKERIHKSVKDPTWKKNTLPRNESQYPLLFIRNALPLNLWSLFVRIWLLDQDLIPPPVTTEFCLPGINPQKTVTIGLHLSFGISSLGRSRMRLISAQSKHPPLHVVVKLIPLFFIFSSCPSISILCLILISCPGTEIKSDPFSHPIPFE